MLNTFLRIYDHQKQVICKEETLQGKGIVQLGSLHKLGTCFSIIFCFQLDFYLFFPILKPPCISSYT